MSGAPFNKGGENGRTAAGTLCSLWAGVDWENSETLYMRHLNGYTALFDRVSLSLGAEEILPIDVMLEEYRKGISHP